MNQKKMILLKALGVLGVLVFLGCAMLILNHSVGNAFQTEELLPKVSDEPVYVECKESESLPVVMKPSEDFHCGGFQLLLVNFSEDSKGTLRVQLADEEQNIYLDEIIPVNTIIPGEWFTVSADVYFESEKNYTISFTADGSNPYFMQIPAAEGENLPFVENVQGVEDAVIISMGVNRVTPVTQTFGDIFYYSVPFCILLSMVLIFIIIIGKAKAVQILEMITGTCMKFVLKFGNESFLLLIFIILTIGVISEAYFKGVYISADSADYLREAVNLAHGNGFSFDGIAGYHSWFAKWPIIYPLLIACMMKLTGVNAYLASKLVTIIMILLILVLIRLVFKKDAWLYALCLTNIGFVNLSYYTWSEIPFMLFELCFALALAEIVQKDKPGKKWYILLGCSALAGFLTRYFGLYMWFVTGFYLLLLLLRYRQKKEKSDIVKMAGLTISAGASGILAVLYFGMNKIMNGQPSGISRGTWWDDYQILTQDLVETLLKEFTNIFSFQIPAYIENFPYDIKVLVLVVLFIGLSAFICKNCKHFTRESVFITTGLIYYLMFIVIRYRSSMDTFYFRFFEPATFLICIGLIGLLLPMIRKKRGLSWFAGITAALLVFGIIAVIENGGLKAENAYYTTLTGQWEEAYADIPEKSVVIFSDIDFRSKYYRPDVVEGTITPQDTFDSVKSTYYGSDYLCIRWEYIEAMLESGEYDRSIAKELEQGIAAAELTDKEYFIIALH